MLAAPILIDSRWLIIVLEWVEKEIELIQDGGQIKKETDIYHHGPGPCISNVSQLPGPPCFSLVTTFKSIKNTEYQHGRMFFKTVYYVLQMIHEISCTTLCVFLLQRTYETKFLMCQNHPVPCSAIKIVTKNEWDGFFFHFNPVKQRSFSLKLFC